MTQPIRDSQAEGFQARQLASRILVVANAKGGVGKTTTVANVGARLAEILDKPVLLIDLDFQGTLSSMSAGPNATWVPPGGISSQSTRLISGDLTPADIAQTGTQANGQEKLKVIRSYFDLAQAENRVMIEWLLGDTKDDIRFRLAKLLHDDQVRGAFSLIIIDCPPRLTTAAVQALAAGTHLLIPTVMDDPSTEAVVTFVRQVENFRNANLCPNLRYIGVAGAKQPPVANIGGPMARLRTKLDDFRDTEVAQPLVKILPEETFFPNNIRFANAVSLGGIAYIVMGNAANDQPVRGSIEALADLVKTEMRL